MMTFPELIKQIRNEAGLTQSEFATALGVSSILIAMIETGQKEVSKRFVEKLAERMRVHPASITPFLFMDQEHPVEVTTAPERLMISWGEKMQRLLIKDRVKYLRKYAE